MAKNQENPAEGNTIDHLNSSMTAAGRKISENKKIIYWVLGCIVAAGALVAAYFYFFHIPGINKATDAYVAAEYQKGKDGNLTRITNDTVLAKNYAKVADEFGGDAGNNAAMQAAEHYYNIGDYKNALKYVEKFDSNEDVIMTSALILKGDCQVNLKKYNEAIESYKKAISESDNNPELAPRAMFKIALVQEALNKTGDMLSTLEQLEKDYPGYTFNGLPVTAYIERAKQKLGK